jgi:hypothetical protein
MSRGPNNAQVEDFIENIGARMSELDEGIKDEAFEFTSDTQTALNLLNYYDKFERLTTKQAWLACKLWMKLKGEDFDN